MIGITLRAYCHINRAVDHTYTRAPSVRATFRDDCEKVLHRREPRSAFTRQRARTRPSARISSWTPRHVLKSRPLTTGTVSSPNGSFDVGGGIIGLAGVTNAILSLARP